MDFHTVHRMIKRNDPKFFTLCCPNSNSFPIISLKSDQGESLLHIASRYDKQKSLEFLLTIHGGDVEVSNNEGKKPLHEAAQYGSLYCLKYLLKKGAEVDPLKRADWTPLMLSCTKNRLDIVETLLEAGADPNLKNKDGWNCFHIAAREGHMAILKSLVKACPSVQYTASNSLRTPLHTAALHGHTEVASWLAQISPHAIDIRDSCGVTPFMDALRSGHVQIASFLALECQANPCLQDQVGREAIHHVAEAGQLKALEFLLSVLKVSVDAEAASTHETAMHSAAKECQVNILEYLISHGGDVNKGDNKGRTALHIACGAQSPACVRCLLRNGACIRADKSGKMPIDLAVKQTVREVFDEVIT